jgi:hypothetical protein
MRMYRITLTLLMICANTAGLAQTNAWKNQYKGLETDQVRQFKNSRRRMGG